MSNVQTMKIYGIIANIEEELEESPQIKRRDQNVREVDIERLYDLLQDLKNTIPEDIRRATGIISEAQVRLNDAKEEAADIVEQAKKEAEALVAKAQMDAEQIHAAAEAEFAQRVDSHSVYQEACVRASMLGQEAEENANAIYNGARKYADDILADLQNYLAEYHSIISQNRSELGVNEIQPEEPRYEEPVRVAEPAPVRKAAPVEPVHAEEEPAGETKAFRRPEKKQPPRREEQIDDYDDYDDEDEDEEPRKGAKKSGGLKAFFSKMFEVSDDDDDEDDEDDWEEEDEKPAKKKGLKGLFSKSSDDDDDDDYYDEDDDY